MHISQNLTEKHRKMRKLNTNTNIHMKQQQEVRKEERPLSSSQNQLRELQKHHSIAPEKKKLLFESKHQSQNKINASRQNRGDTKGQYNKLVDRSQLEREDYERDSTSHAHNHRKRKGLQEVLVAVPNPSASELAKVSAYYRYLPLSVLASAGLRDQFMSGLAEQLELRPLNPFKKSNGKRDVGGLWERLSKQAQLKAKYKYREKCSYGVSLQLKLLDYKYKEAKRKRQSQESSDSDDIKEKCRSMQTWKRTMGVDGKVFVIKGKYPDLRAALLERGWVENMDKKSNFFDLRWTSKIIDINFPGLRPNQIVNHFDNNACLTSKYGLIKSIRAVMYPENMDTDRFFPKAFDLSHLGDFQSFIEVFKWVYCESLLKRAQELDNRLDQTHLMKVSISMIITERRMCDLNTVLKAGLNCQYQFCTVNEWNFLNDKPCNMEEIAKTISASNVDGGPKGIEALLRRLKEQEPQFNLNGCQDIWIIKPAFLSRGRGIKCLTGLTEILDACLGKERQYVVQKYIQNPLIINKRKFDIRVWVVVEDYLPPRVWFYNQFYIRFCLEDYNTDTLKNKYAHLTNNSIQKYNSKMGASDLEGSMWDRDTFERYICDNYGRENFKVLLGKMKEIVVATVLGPVDQVYGRKGSFEQLGYDMMIDEDLNPWLIEINSSPAMDYSTPITRKLVKMVMEDIVKIVVDLRKKKNKIKAAGEFRLIYAGEGFKSKYYRMGKAKGAEEEEEEEEE